jgi:hypothetical protein
MTETHVAQLPKAEPQWTNWHTYNLDVTPPGASHRWCLRNCLLQECEVMAADALASGRQIPAPVMRVLASGG